MAHQLGRIDASEVAEHRRVVAGYDLPLHPPWDITFDRVLPLLGRDKKAIDGLTFVLSGPDGPEVVTGVAPQDCERAYAALRS